MPNIRLPDGAVKSFDAPVTVAEVAASIGPGLAKAALAGTRRRQARRHVVRDRPRRRRRDRHRQGSRRPRGAPPLDRAPARLRGEGALSRRAGDDRPGDRGRLLLRLLVQAPVHARGPRGDRGEDGRAREEGRARDAAHDAARRRGRVLQVDRRALQGRDHRVDPVGRGHLALLAKASSPTSAAARTCRRPASSRSSS